MEPNNVIAPSIWAEHGLAGLVIMALFACLILGFRTWSQERKEASEIIKNATDAYRSDVKEITDRQNETTEKVADKFTELHREVIEMLHGDRKGKQ